MLIRATWRTLACDSLFPQHHEVASLLLRLRYYDDAPLISAALPLWGSGLAVVTRTGLRVQQLVDKPQQSWQGVKLRRLPRDDVFYPASELPARDVGVRIELYNKRPIYGQVDRVVVWLRHSPSWCKAQ